MRYDTEPNREATVPGRGGGLDAIEIALVQARPVPPPVTRLPATDDLEGQCKAATPAMASRCTNP
jgi:hypothetical protein